MLQIGVESIFKWIFDRKFYLHLKGYRPEVICLVRATGKKPKFLLISPEKDRSVWTPPQEGIHLEDTIEQTVKRCLKIELGFDENKIHFRRSVWVGKRLLPKNRHDERSLRFSLRKLKKGSSMVGKAYFAALVTADARTVVDPNPAEVYRWKWVSAKEFRRLIATNVPDKVSILQKAWQKLLGDL